MLHSNLKIVSITVCRKGSVRVPNKTWEKIGDKSLLDIKVSQLKKVSYLSDVIVGSNDDNVEQFCKETNTTFIRRPEYFCNESKCTPNDMIKNMLSYIDADVILWAHLTNPFINEKHYSEAIEIFLNNNKKYDSLFSAVQMKEHFWNTDKTPLNHNPYSSVHVVAKDLQPIYKQNGGIFIQHKDSMETHGRFIGDQPFMYVMGEMEGWDLDYTWQIEAARRFKFE